MNALYAELQWLPRPPADIRDRLAAAGRGMQSPGLDLQAIAGFALDLNALTKLGKTIDRARADGICLEPLTPFRLAILGNSTVDLIVPALVASAARHGIVLEVVPPTYDQVAQQALGADSAVNAAKPDAVLLAIDYRGLPLRAAPGEPVAAAATIQECVSYLTALRDGIKSNSGAVCIFQTLAAPVETLFGSFDRLLPGTLRNLVDGVNAALASHALESGDAVLDTAGLAETVGLADWHDTQAWNLGKFPFSDELIPLYADHVARTLSAIRGKSRKLLVLDLDNTIWGGIIGDDGLEGIRIAQGDAAGEAHLAVQRMALDLRRRGIVLAVASKNSDEIARMAFDRHPDMLLKLEHIAVFQANWNDKASNIQAIAETLSLGLDSVVFLDDNPAERGLVRSLLPQVAVPELPEEPAFYARTLAAGGYFDTLAFTTEDRERAGMYQDNARRAILQRQAGGVDAYLKSLDMTITFTPFDAVGRARIAQLINKSNQFNLTTRRYTEVEVASAEIDPDVFTLQVRLSDTFGDNGMISVVICRPAGPSVWDIDTWLMSCRVLGRNVEAMVLREILKHARAADCRKLTGTYRPTARNMLVRDHYAKLGFTRVDELESGLARWELDVDPAEPPEAPMTVISCGFPNVENVSGDSARRLAAGVELAGAAPKEAL